MTCNRNTSYTKGKLLLSTRRTVAGRNPALSEKDVKCGKEIPKIAKEKVAT